MTRPRKRAKRIGIYGGTFSPIHYGHLMCAEWVADAYDLDRVLFVTSATPPNKRSGVLDAEERHEMVVAAVADNPRFEPSRIDLEHGGSGYSLLTVEAARERFGADAELFYISSAEYLDPEHRWWLKRWVGAKELFKLCTFIIFPRDAADLQKARQWAKLIPEARIEVMFTPSPPLSSTMLRERVAKGRSIWYTTPWNVQQIIAKKGHYRPEGILPRPKTVVPPEQIESIGIYGGQFNPIHYGHLMFAEWAAEEYGLDRVLFVTSANPPNNGEVAATAEDRHEMVVAAVADNPWFEASRLDLDRKTKSYALLTVEQIQAKYGEHVQLNWLLSSEYLNPEHPWYLPKWMGAEALFQLVRFLVFPTDLAEVDTVKEWAKLIPQARIEVMYAPAPPVTAEMIRERVSSGLSIRYMTPWVVQQTIGKRELYSKAADRKRSAGPKTRRRRSAAASRHKRSGC